MCDAFRAGCLSSGADGHSASNPVPCPLESGGCVLIRSFDFSDEPAEQLRNETRPAPSPDSLASSFESLQLSTVLYAATESPSAGTPHGGRGSRRGSGTDQPEGLGECGSWPDPWTFGADINQTSSPLEPCQAGGRPLPSGESSPERESDLSSSQPDSMTYSPRGYFYYLSTSEEGDFCRGSPSLPECRGDGSFSASPSCLLSSSGGSGNGEASGEAGTENLPWRGQPSWWEHCT